MKTKTVGPKSRKQSRSRKTSHAKNGLVNTREMFAAIDTAGQEAWIQLLDQSIHTFGEAAQRDYDAFVRVVYALERAGYQGDATICALAGLDENKVAKANPEDERH